MVDNCLINVMKKLFTMCVMLCCVMVAMGQEFTLTTDEGYRLKYKVTSARAREMECRGMVDKNTAGAADLVIHEDDWSTSGTYYVKEIASGAFLDCNGFTGRLVLPVALMTIGDDAFRGCSGFIGSLVIPDATKSIGDDAFRGCDAFEGSLLIPDGVTNIGARAFADCNGITDLQVGAGNDYYSTSDMMLFSKDMTSIVFALATKKGELIIPESVVTIKEGAFYGCAGLTGSLMIPDTVDSIGENAFEGCSGITSSLTIGSAVTNIGAEAFSGCSGITEVISLATTPPALGLEVFRGTSLETIWVPKGTLTTYVTADGWRDLDASLFVEMGDVEVLEVQITTPNTLWDEIEAKGEQLSTVTRMKVSGELGDDDWRVIKNQMPILYELDMTEVVNTTIHSDAFAGSKIVCFKFPKETAIIGESAFSGSQLCGELKLPMSVKSIGDGAFSNCSNLTGKVELPHSLISVEEDLFSGCSGIEHVVIPAKVTDIAYDAFNGCVALDTLTCLSMKPVYMSTRFSTIDPSTCVLQVPKGARSAYFNANVWEEFVNIKQIEVAIPQNTVCVKFNDGGVVLYENDTVAHMQELKVYAGSVLKLGIVPDAGYSVTNITLNGESMMDNYVDGILTTPAIDEDMELNIKFETMLVTVTMNDGGTVRYEGNAVTYGEQINVAIGEALELSIVPDTGREVTSITLNRVDILGNYVNGVLTTPAVTADMELKVVFGYVKYKVSLYEEGAAIRYVTAANHGLDQDVYIIAEENYEITSVTVNGEDVTSNLSEDGKLTINNITEDKVVLVKTRNTNSSTPQTSNDSDFTAWGAQRTIYVEATQDMEQVRVIDLEGRVVHSAAVSAYSVMQVQMPQSGVYVVQAEMKDGTLKAKKIML